MHACRGGWAGQAFALATSNDSGGKKSRIRRSKEERKSMVESFIKKYQQSNNGNFPSLNLAHKEVGGSFYTVRELVREIIQENRVLAPPKVSLEENGHSGFLEQHPLGSISMEPQIDLSESERVHMVTHIAPDKYQISTEGNISSSSESYSLEMDNAHIINGVTKVAVKDEGFDRTSVEEEKIVNVLEVLDESPHSDNPVVTNVDHQDNIDGSSLSIENVNGIESQWPVNEQGHNKNDDVVDKNEEFGQRIHSEPAVMETLYTEKLGAQNIETSEAIKSPMNSDVVVEKFPLRPVPKTIQNMDGECGKLHETAVTLEDNALQNEKKTYTQSSSGSVNKGEEKLSDLTVELNAKNGDEKVGLNLQGPKSSSASKPSLLATELESKISSPEANRRTDTSISEVPTAVGGKSSDQDNGSLPKGISPTLDRINLETWEGASKKSTRPENNPLLALVKAFISSFVKFWTE
ncbi:hypothetical protein ACS0TY_000672 [Phlomoides rotata]